MRKTMIVALAVAVALSAGAARADKTASAFVDPTSTGTNGFHNLYSGNKLAKTYSVGAVKTSGCKMKIQFKALTGLSPGDKLICLLGADACIIPPPGNCTGLRFGNTIVALMPYDTTLSKGGTKLDTRDIGCGGVDATATGSTIACYKPGAYNPATQCAADGGLWVNNDTFAPGAEGSDGLLGLCQWFNPGVPDRLTPPGTGLVASDGVSTPGPLP